MRGIELLKVLYLTGCVVTIDAMGCQKEIVNEIAAKIDSLVAKTQTSIEKLKEYRTALISAVVTGKVDVTSKEI